MGCNTLIFRRKDLFCFTKVKGIIFDLDDTLVHANLNFAKIKAAVGCPPNADILQYIEKIKCEKTKQKAHETVLWYELEDAKTSRMIAGAHTFIKQALAHELPLAIVTRNCREATQIKLESNDIPIDLVITREDAPPKPNPEALLNILNQWQNDLDISSGDLAYIGDYQYDIDAAHNAGMQAWLFTFNAKHESYENNLKYIPKPSQKRV